MYVRCVFVQYAAVCHYRLLIFVVKEAFPFFIFSNLYLTFI